MRTTRSTPLVTLPAMLMLGLAAGCDQRDDGGGAEAQDRRPAPSGEDTSVGAARDRERSLPAGMKRDRTEVNDERASVRMGFPSNEDPVLVIERRGPAQVRAGEPLTYDLVITNASEEMMLHDVAVTQALLLVDARGHDAQDRALALPENIPEAHRFAEEARRRATELQRTRGEQQQQQQQQQEATQGEDGRRRWTEEGGRQLPSGMVQTWNIAMLAPGESLTFQGRLVPTESGTVHVCTSATYEQAYCSPIEVVAPALGLQAMVVDAEGRRVGRILACDDVFLSFRVTNPGSAATPPVRLTQPIPEGVTVEGQQGQQVQLQLDPIAPGESVERRLALDFEGALTFQGEALAEAGDLSARAPLPVVLVMKPTVGFEVNGPSRTYLGRPVTYGIEVLNPGPAPAFDVSVRPELPGGDRLEVAGANVEEEDGAYQLGDLKPGEVRTFSVTLEPREAGTFAATFAVEGYCLEALQRRVETEVVGVAALRLETIDLTDPVAVGETAVYEVQVKNQGSAEDLDIRLQATLPPQLRFLDGSGDTAVHGQGQDVQFEPVARLAPGDVMTWRVRAKVLQPGQARLALEMTSRATQQPIIEQEPTTLIERGPAGARGAERGGELEPR
jgi:uncharacterized repeat protein (TIGR01451 family)